MSAQENIQRTVLPIPDMPRVGLTTYDGLCHPEGQKGGEETFATDFFTP
jgi:hypothetical protein